MAPEQNSQILATIKVLSGPRLDSELPITQSITTIGRDRSNTIVIAESTVSRFHARLIYEHNVWRIEKISQTNAVRLNQQNVAETALLMHNSVINLGMSVSLRFLLSPANKTKGPNTPSPISPPSYTHEIDNTPPDSIVFNPSLEMPQAVALQIKNQPAEQNGKQTPGTEVASFTSMGVSSLEVTDNTIGLKQIHPLIQEKVSIGRDPANDIMINALSVSDLHFQLIREKDNWILIHPHPDRLRTLHGLLYQGQIIQGDESFRKRLAYGDVFRIGDEHGSLVTLTYRDGTNRSQNSPVRMEPIRLETTKITLGRSQQNDVVLNHPQVSAFHAYLLQERDGYQLVDLSSTNHTYVNGLSINKHLLSDDDDIRIGPFRFVYADMALKPFDESQGIRIDALHLKKTGNSQTILLNGVSLSIPARSFAALVGSSGAGKTTLLNALSGLHPAQEGSVLYNGQDALTNRSSFSLQMGYVPQDDIIHRELTVERSLYYAARLRLPPDFLKAQIIQRIDSVLDDVEMQHRRKLLISQLSGGQRKRVSIALELLSMPSIFFLDEPTSGLDPGLDRKMMILLRKLADKGHTILLVTHATNNINVCDYVCFMAPGGNLAYFGPPEEAKTYFRQPDFAEIYSALEVSDRHTTSTATAKEKFEQSHIYQKYIQDPLQQEVRTKTGLLREQLQLKKSIPRRHSFRQFSLLTRRYLELLRNDLGNLAILLLQAPLIGLLLLLFIHGIGVNSFAASNVIQCPSTNIIINAKGFPDVPTPINPIVSKSCQRVNDFLQHDTMGKVYATTHGGAINALQDFIIPGPGYAPTVLFLMAFSAIMFGCINAIRELVKEAPIYQRERAVNLGILPYLFSKIVVLGTLCLLQSLILEILIIVVDPFAHSVFLPAFLEIYITIALTSLVGLMMGLAISAIVPNNDRATSFIPLLLLPQVIFSGTLFPLNNWFLQYLGMLFPIRWAMAALGSTVGLHSDKLNGDQLFGTNYTYHSTLFTSYSLPDATHYLMLMWLALLVMLLLFGAATGYFLKRKDVRA